MRSVLAAAFVLIAGNLDAQENLPPGKGRETLENTCTECHGLDKALAEFHTRERWQKIAVEMRSKGATMSDSELDTLVDYLFTNFGIDVEKVNVNKASAKVLADELQLTSSEAAAIVRYRDANGPFKEWRDLTKIVEVDKRKIEAVKDRLVF